MGIKMIPPGVHIIHYSPAGAGHRVIAPRTSLFTWTKPQDIIIYRWDKENEGLAEVSDQEHRQYSTGVRRLDFDKNLAPYPHNLLKTWKGLTPHITPEVLNRLEPIQRFRIAPKASLKPKGNSSSTSKAPASETAQHSEDTKATGSMETEKPELNSGGDTKATKPTEEKNPNLKIAPSVIRRRFYSKIPNTRDAGAAERKVLQGELEKARAHLEDLRASPTCTAQAMENAQKAMRRAQLNMRKCMAVTTATNLDKSPVLGKLISTGWKGNQFGVLGEVEFAFCSFLLGESLEGLEQWKHLTRMLCSCDTAVDTKQDLFAAFTRLLSAQFRSLPKDFFSDALSSENFLRSCLRDYLEILEDSPKRSAELRKEEAQLRALLKSKFGWSLKSELERELDGPVVVNLTEQMRKELKLS